jgi:hypothetical protein
MAALAAFAPEAASRLAAKVGPSKVPAQGTACGVRCCARLCPGCCFPSGSHKQQGDVTLTRGWRNEAKLAL